MLIYISLNSNLPAFTYPDQPYKKCFLKTQLVMGGTSKTIAFKTKSCKQKCLSSFIIHTSINVANSHFFPCKI